MRARSSTALSHLCSESDWHGLQQRTWLAPRARSLRVICQHAQHGAGECFLLRFLPLRFLAIVLLDDDPIRQPPPLLQSSAHAQGGCPLTHLCNMLAYARDAGPPCLSWKLTPPRPRPLLPVPLLTQLMDGIKALPKHRGDTQAKPQDSRKRRNADQGRNNDDDYGDRDPSLKQAIGTIRWLVWLTAEATKRLVSSQPVRRRSNTVFHHPPPQPSHQIVSQYRTPQ